MKYLPLVALLIAAGCVSAGTRQQKLKTRASFDLHCPSDKLVLSELGDSTAGVRGCGQQATYLWLGNAWSIDGAVTSDPPTASPRT